MQRDLCLRLCAPLQLHGGVNNAYRQAFQSQFHTNIVALLHHYNVVAVCEDALVDLSDDDTVVDKNGHGCTRWWSTIKDAYRA